MKTMMLDKICKPGHARGRRGRTAALVATVAISACMSLRLDAVVIDDFGGPVKFAEGGGGTNYFLFVLTNGQLAVSRQNPIPTPPSSAGTTYDNVYWQNSLPGVSLEGGRTLELRMDLNHTSADDLFLLLGAGDGDNVYAAIVDRNEVALMKYGVFGMASFFWDVLAITNENVTVRLAFTKTNSSLAITVKIVDRDNQRATLYERSFVDGPGQDGPVPPPDPHGIKLFNQDLGVPYTNFTYAWAGAWQLIPTSPPPLEMLLDNLEYDVCHPPHLEIARATNGVSLNWLLPVEEHIVVEADQLAGPWCPCSQPHTRIGDAFYLNMPCLEPQKFWRLTPGRQYTNDFSSAVPTWTPWFQNAGVEWIITNGILQVSLSNRPDYGGLALCPLGATNVEAVLRDFSASVDILDWVTSGTNWSAVALFGRGRVYPSYGTAYFGGIGLNYDGIPGRVTPWIHNGSTETWGPPFDIGAFPPPYRLQFSGVGNKMSLRVVNLTTGELIREMSFTNSAYATGIVGLWFNGRTDAGDSYTITVDNFFVTGTKR
jgi:hypothetical protein